MPEFDEAATQENPEIQGEVPEVEADGEPESEQEVENRPKPVPYDVFREVNERLRASEENNRQMQALILQTQQQQYLAQQAAARASQKPRAPVDAEVEEFIAPILEKHIGPLQEELYRVKQNENLLIAEKQAKAAWEYVKDNVPDFDDLAHDIQNYLSGLPPSRVEKITSDPDLVIQTAELVRERKAAGKVSGVRAAKADLKARSKGDEGSAHIPSRTPTNVDWSRLSDDEVLAMERKLGIKR